MIVARKALQSEVVEWMEECLDERYYIKIDDIMINSIGEPRRVDPKDLRELFLPENVNLIMTYLELESGAMKKLLEGRDDFFKLERVSVTDSGEIKLYFDKNVLILYSLSVDRSLFPSFTVAKKHISGEVVRKTRLTVREDYSVRIEKIW